MANEKILVVDDDVNICELLRLYLEKEGYTVSIVNDGESAVKSFGEIQPDLMLLDIMLPRLDGWQVCREIRKFSDKPIIMLTAKGETFDKVLGLELGADDYVVKPFDAWNPTGRFFYYIRNSKMNMNMNMNSLLNTCFWWWRAPFQVNGRVLPADDFPLRVPEALRCASSRTRR